MVTKSRLVPALRNNSLPTISKFAASVPDTLRVLVPRESSLIIMLPSLIAVVVFAFSSKVVVVFATLTATGAALLKV